MTRLRRETVVRGQARMQTVQARTWAFTAFVILLGAGTCLLAFGLDAPNDRPFGLGWVVLAVAFGAAESYTVKLEVRRETHSLTFSELPLTLGLVFAEPSDLIVGRIVGSALAFVFVRRPPIVKILFSVGQFALEAGAALLVFHSILGRNDPVEPLGWVAGLAAIAVAHFLGWIMVSNVMRLAGAPVSLRSELSVLPVSGSASLAECAVALGAAGALWRNGWSWILLAIIGGALGYFFFAYVRIRERHQALATLHAFTTKLSASSSEDLIATVLRGVAEILRSKRVIVLISRDDHVEQFAVEEDQVTQSVADLAALVNLDIAASLGSGAVGTPKVCGVVIDGTNAIAARLPLSDRNAVVIVDGRLSDARGFDSEDVQLLETAAGYAASAIHNSQLVTKLRTEATFRAHQALHDDITDLPNSRALVEHLEERLAAGVRLITLTLRVHSLREVNETLGRSVGDEMLREVAERLPTLAEGSWCARSGTDEFTLVVAGGQHEADQVAADIVDAFEQPVLCGDVALAVTVGIGLVLAPQHGTEAEMLVRRASLAASRSAIEGTTVTTWAADRDPYDPQRLTIAADLRDAIPAGELDVQFQPQVDMKTGVVTGAEALVRWSHPRLGQLRPDQFIAAAEHTGAIDALTFHVLTVATETGRRWHDRGWDLEMAVNLSARNLTSPRFASAVADILAVTGFPAESLTLELTESSVMTEAERALTTLNELHALGISLSIDDFGTGYSSLAHLRRLPVGEIKIDKSFVFDLTTNESDEAIVKSMVELGHTLSLRVVVEGVETVEVRDRLHKIGSDRLQGYLVSRPLSASAFEHWMQERNVRSASDELGGTARVVNFQSRR